MEIAIILYYITVCWFTALLIYNDSAIPIAIPKEQMLQIAFSPVTFPATAAITLAQVIKRN